MQASHRHTPLNPPSRRGLHTRTDTSTKLTSDTGCMEIIGAQFNETAHNRIHTSRSAAVRLVSDAYEPAPGSAPAVTLCRPSKKAPHTPTAGKQQAGGHRAFQGLRVTSKSQKIDGSRSKGGACSAGRDLCERWAGIAEAVARVVMWAGALSSVCAVPHVSIAPACPSCSPWEERFAAELSMQSLTAAARGGWSDEPQRFDTSAIIRSL